MKYYKITLRQEPGGKLIYPSAYQSEIGNFSQDHIYYDDEQGNPLLLLCIEDSDANDIIRPYVNEVTEVEAKQISEDNETRTEEIVDEAKVRRIEIKSRLGLELSTDELKAVDPNDPDSCFKVSKILADRVVNLKDKESKKVK